MQKKIFSVPLAAITLGLALTGCGNDGSPSSGTKPVNVAALVPADKEIADIYNRSCRSCHTIASTTAPLTGDTAAWEPRMARGMDAMLDSVINGSGGMPPFGLCMDCDVEQFEALINFMATGK